MDDTRVKRAGVIINPLSGKRSGHGLALAAKLAGAASVAVKLLERFGQLSDFLDEFAREGVTDLFISSGDGTVHAIQTDLAERKPFRHLPRLTLLPHGTTNMTAADPGFNRKGIDAQADFIQTLAAKDLRKRPTLRVANPRGGKPLHGMFLGAGAIWQGTLFCQEAFNSKGMKGNFAAFATVAGSIARALFTAPNPSDVTRLDRPHPITIEADGQPLTNGQHTLLLSTTLHKLVLNTKPFWGKGPGDIHSTVIPYPLPSIPRWLFPVMYGTVKDKGPPGTLSFAATEMAIRTPSSFVIDGEFFDPPDQEPLKVETGPEFTYVCG